jgi:imidazolonepropionase-like amidohydrolase
MLLKKEIILFFCCIFILACIGNENQNDVLILKGATLFDGNGATIENSILVIQEGKIIGVGGETYKIPRRAEIVDVSGKFITPGLVDAHIHFFQTGFFDSRPDALDLRDSLPIEEVYNFQKENPDRYYETYLRCGVTAVYDVGGNRSTIELQNEVENNLKAPHVAASGPLITPSPEEMISIFNLDDDKVMVHLGSEEIGRETVRENHELGATGIKIWGLAVNDSSFMKNLEAVADEIEKLGNKMIAHATSLDQAKEALLLDAKLLVHSVADVEVDDEFLELLKGNGAVYNPTLIVMDGYYYARKAVLGHGFKMTDPNNVIDEKTKNLLNRAENFKGFLSPGVLEWDIELIEENLKSARDLVYKNLMEVYKSGGLIAVGTDAGNPGTLHGISIYDEMEAMQEAGISALDLITIATKNGAIAMDREGDFGTIEQGKIANIIVMEKDPSEDISNMRTITHVMRGGTMMSVKEKF